MRRVVVVGAILILISLAYLFVGFIVARGQWGQADDAINQAFTDLKQLDPLLTGSSLANDANAVTDPTAVSETLIGDYATINAAQQTVANSQSGLDVAGRGLDGSWITAPENNQLEQRRSHIEHARAALALLTRAFGIGRTQLDFLTTFTGGLSAFTSAGKALGTKDLASAHADFASALKEFQRSADLAKRPDIPPQLQKTIPAFEKGCSDGAAYVEAVQAGNQGAVSRLSASIKADAAAGSIDQASVAAWVKQHFEAVRKEFETEVAKASG